jgi:hypothetical protein
VSFRELALSAVLQPPAGFPAKPGQKSPSIYGQGGPALTVYVSSCLSFSNCSTMPYFAAILLWFPKYIFCQKSRVKRQNPAFEGKLRTSKVVKT